MLQNNCEGKIAELYIRERLFVATMHQKKENTRIPTKHAKHGLLLLSGDFWLPYIYIYIYVVGKKEQFARLLISLKNSKDPNILLQGGKKTKEKSVNC